MLDQNVSGSSEWWRCKLYGRHGLAPANRLELLPQAATTENIINQDAERTIDSAQNIYQIPSVPRQVTSPVYEPMKAIYKVPSAPPSASKCSAFQHSPGESDADKVYTGVFPFSILVIMSKFTVLFGKLAFT